VLEHSANRDGLGHGTRCQVPGIACSVVPLTALQLSAVSLFFSCPQTLKLRPMAKHRESSDRVIHIAAPLQKGDQHQPPPISQAGNTPSALAEGLC
jgi:hypothetical protein